MGAFAGAACCAHVAPGSVQHHVAVQLQRRGRHMVQCRLCLREVRERDLMRRARRGKISRGIIRESADRAQKKRSPAAAKKVSVHLMVMPRNHDAPALCTHMVCGGCILFVLVYLHTHFYVRALPAVDEGLLLHTNACVVSELHT